MKTTNCLKCGSVKSIKKGYDKTKHNYRPVPRYKCKDCGLNFSSHSARETKGQHRPEINEMIFKLASSAVTMRRIAKIVGCTRNTVERKLDFIADLARVAHKKSMANIKTPTLKVHFDELETFQHTKCKPLSIALAVDASDGLIIDAQVAMMRCKGKLAKFAANKYPNWDTDNRGDACKSVLKSVSEIDFGVLKISTDMKTSYPNIIKSVIPSAVIESFLSRKLKDKGEYDPMFYINHVSAMIRSDLSRMRRKTWATTKDWSNLQRHLDIYIAWNNKYSLNLNWS